MATELQSTACQARVVVSFGAFRDFCVDRQICIACQFFVARQLFVVWQAGVDQVNAADDSNDCQQWPNVFDASIALLGGRNACLVGVNFSGQFFRRLESISWILFESLSHYLCQLRVDL